MNKRSILIVINTTDDIPVANEKISHAYAAVAIVTSPDVIVDGLDTTKTSINFMTVAEYMEACP